jgi:hypothetical protein
MKLIVTLNGNTFTADDSDEHGEGLDMDKLQPLFTSWINAQSSDAEKMSDLTDRLRVSRERLQSTVDSVAGGEDPLEGTYTKER